MQIKTRQWYVLLISLIIYKIKIKLKSLKHILIKYLNSITFIWLILIYQIA